MNGVQRRCRRDDHPGVTVCARERLEFVGEMAADSAPAVAVAHVQVGQLRDARPDVGFHDPDPDEPPIREGDEPTSSGCEVALALRPLRGNGVLAIAFRGPGRGAEVARSLLEV